MASGGISGMRVVTSVSVSEEPAVFLNMSYLGSDQETPHFRRFKLTRDMALELTEELEELVLPDFRYY